MPNTKRQVSNESINSSCDIKIQNQKGGIDYLFTLIVEHSDTTSDVRFHWLSSCVVGAANASRFAEFIDRSIGKSNNMIELAKKGLLRNKLLANSYTKTIADRRITFYPLNLISSSPAVTEVICLSSEMIESHCNYIKGQRFVHPVQSADLMASILTEIKPLSKSDIEMIKRAKIIHKKEYEELML